VPDVSLSLYRISPLGDSVHGSSTDDITVCAFDWVNICIRAIVETIRVERVAFTIGHSCAVRCFFSAADGNRIPAVILELVVVVPVVNASIVVLPSSSVLGREQDVQGPSPLRGTVRKLMSTERCSIHVLVGLNVEIGIPLDGLECAHQNNDGQSWTESTHPIVIAHTQLSRPQGDSPSSAFLTTRCIGLEDAQIEFLGELVSGTASQRGGGGGGGGRGGRGGMFSVEGKGAWSTRGLPDRRLDW